MNLTEKEYAKIAELLPTQRGNVRYENLTFLNALLYIAENGCKWRSLPKEYGNWNSIYKKANRWAKSGVLDKVFMTMQKEQIIRVKIERVSIDSTNVKVHPDAHGALKKLEYNQSGNPTEDGTQSFMWLPRMIRSL